MQQRMTPFLTCMPYMQLWNHNWCSYTRDNIISLVKLYWLFHSLAIITKGLQRKTIDIFKVIKAVNGDFHAVNIVQEFSKI